MNGLAPLVQALGWALIDFVWQGALVALGLILLLRWVPVEQSRTRYALACGALAVCLLLPLSALLGAGGQAAEARQSAWIVLATEQVAQGGTPGLGKVVMAWLNERLPMLVSAWAAAVAVLAARYAYGLCWVRSVVRHAHPKGARALQDCADRLGQALRVPRPVTLHLTQGLDTPVTAGWWKPVILIPAALATGMPWPLLEALIAHELAHVRRFDYLVNLVQSVVETLLFYHPAVWWISRVIRTEREHVADDLAGQVLGEPRRLALALRELDQFQFAAHQLMQASHGGNLKARIERLVRPTPRVHTANVTVAAMSVALACAALVAQADLGAASAPILAPPAVPVPPAVPTLSAVPALPATPARAPADLAPPAPPAVPAVPAVPASPAPAATPAARTIPATPALPAFAAVHAPPAPPALATIPAPPAVPAQPDLTTPPPPPAPASTGMDKRRVNARVDFKSCARPSYPKSALKDEKQGAATFSFLIGIDGNVKEARIMQSSGHAELDQAALEALRVCKFIPSQVDGVFTELWAPVKYVWTLSDPAKASPRTVSSADGATMADLGSVPR
jgi:TonB family protein